MSSQSPSAATQTAPEMFYVKSVIGDQPWLRKDSVLVSAGVAWRNPGEGFTLPPPEAETLFVDSGGFQAAVHFRDEYPYTPTELFEWADSIDADYVAGMDWACETATELAKDYDGVSPSDIAPLEERIDRTIQDQRRQLKAYEQGEWDFELVPVVQGYTIAQYRQCARRLRVHNLARKYMGIGTVCKRDSPTKILEVLDACEDELPITEFHLFGATKRIWNDRRFWGRFRSADTHAWAMKTPEGEWTANNADKRRAYGAYSADIEQTQAQIKQQSTFKTDSDPYVTVGFEEQECVCGTTIPAYQTEFTPGCRYCQSTALNRWDAALADLEQGGLDHEGCPDPAAPVEESSVALANFH